MRPVDIEADVKEMERRKRVEAIMNSQVVFSMVMVMSSNISHQTKGRREKLSQSLASV